MRIPWTRSATRLYSGLPGMKEPKMGTSRFGKAGLAVFLFLCLFAVETHAGERPADVRRDDLWRIETAYEIGLQAAETPRERAQCLRLRAIALSALVERTYESLLVSVADRESLLRALEGDQLLWRGQVADAMADDRDLERAASLLLGRAGVFATVIEALDER